MGYHGLCVNLAIKKQLVYIDILHVIRMKIKSIHLRAIPWEWDHLTLSFAWPSLFFCKTNLLWSSCMNKHQSLCVYSRLSLISGHPWDSAAWPE